MPRRDERIHPKEFFYLNVLLAAFLARELLRAGAASNFRFRIKHNATNATHNFFLGLCLTHIVCRNFHSKKLDLS